VGHARAVGLAEQVVAAERAQVDVLQAGHRLGALGLGPARAVRGEHVGAAGHAEGRPGVRVEQQLERGVPGDRVQAGAERQPAQAEVERQPLRRAGQQGHGGGEDGGGAGGGGPEAVGGVGLVAAEQLVAALAAQHRLDPRGDRAAGEPVRQRGGVGARLVERGGDRGQAAHGVLGGHDDLVVVGRVARGDPAGDVALVERSRAGEADGERRQARAGRLGRQRAQRAGVHAARQQDADLGVAAQVGADRPAQALAQLGGEHRRGLAPDGLGGHGRRARNAHHAHAVVVGDQQRARGDAPDGAHDRALPEHRPAGQQLVERHRVELARDLGEAQQRTELRREDQRVAEPRVDQRLDPERIAGQDEAALAGVPHRGRPHAAQAVGEAQAAVLVAVDQDLAVRPAGEAVPARLEGAALAGVLVQLAVGHHLHGAVLRADRLRAAGGVDERQAPRAERRAAVDETALAVGAPVRLGVEQHVERVGPRRRRVAQRDDAGDPAHQQAPYTAKLRLPPSRVKPGGGICRSEPPSRGTS
jgi:hypothetical protein